LLSGKWFPCARHVAIIGWLHLYNRGAEISGNHRSERPGHAAQSQKSLFDQVQKPFLMFEGQSWRRLRSD